MNNTWLHDPSISTIDAEGNLRVDLTALAVKARAPLTPQTFGCLSLMVQRYFRAMNPSAECRIELPNSIETTKHGVIIPNYDTLQKKSIDKGPNHGA